MRSTDIANWCARNAMAFSLAAIASVNAAAQGSSAAAPVSVDSTRLSGRDFFAAYTDESPAVRERAQLYLLGVMDSTEGSMWCSYRVAKTITLREIVFESLRTQPDSRMKNPASALISDALRSALPCKVKQ